MDFGECASPRIAAAGAPSPTPSSASEISVGSAREMAPRSDLTPSTPASPVQPASPDSPAAPRSRAGDLPMASPASTGTDLAGYESGELEEDYFGPLRRLGPAAPESTAGGRCSDGLKSFSVHDILNHRSSRRKCAVPMRIVRPWDSSAGGGERRDAATPPPTRPEKAESQRKRPTGNAANANPLDELFKMTNKTLQDFKDEKQGEQMVTIYS